MPPAAGSGPIEISSSPWHVRAGEPTTLLAMMPGESPPTLDDVNRALLNCGAAESQQQFELARQPGVNWQNHLEFAGVRGPMIFWCERAEDIQPGTFGDAAIESCRWIVGVQTLLHVDEPPESYAALLQLITTALPDCPGVFDVNTNMCHPRAFLDDQLLLDEAPAATDWLWRIEVVAGGSEARNETLVWMRTAGLNRCWRAELELFNVPHRLANAGGQLLNLLAEQSLDGPLPEPDEPFDVGADLVIVLRRVVDVLAAVPDDVIGSAAFRRANEIDRERLTVVVVDPQQLDNGGTPAPPLRVLECIAAGRAAVYRTTRITARQAALARKRWPAFVNAWRQSRNTSGNVSDHHFLVKAAVNTGPKDDASREHMWFEIESFNEHDQPVGRAAHNATAPGAPSVDEQCALDPAGISDWLIVTPAGRFTPAHFGGGALTNPLQETGRR